MNFGIVYWFSWCENFSRNEHFRGFYFCVASDTLPCRHHMMLLNVIYRIYSFPHIKRNRLAFYLFYSLKKLEFFSFSDCMFTTKMLFKKNISHFGIFKILWEKEQTGKERRFSRALTYSVLKTFYANLPFLALNWLDIAS